MSASLDEVTTVNVSLWLPKRVYDYIEECWGNDPPTDKSVADLIAEALTEIMDSDRETPER